MGAPVIGTVGPGGTATGDAPVKVGGVTAGGIIKTLKVNTDGTLAVTTAAASEVQILGADGVTLGVITSAGALLSGLETGSLYVAGVAVTPKFAAISASTSGATTVVAAVSSKKIRVLSYVLIANGAVNVKFQSHTVPTDKTGLFYLVANSGAAVSYSPVGHFETVSGEALDINLSASVAVGGHLVYLEV